MRTLPRLVLALLPGMLLGCSAASYERAPSVVGPRLADSGGRGLAYPGGATGEVTVQAVARRAPGRLLARKAPADEGAPRTVASPAATQDAAKADPARFIVRSAYLRIERKDPENGVTAAAELARRLGGWVQRTENKAATIMVPAEKLDAALDELGRLGKVAKKDVRGEDVTEEYLDLRIRLDNLEKARLRYLDLLNQAQNVGETLAVEKELERITVDIERLKGRLGYLERVVRYSTIQVLFERPQSPGPVGWVFYILYHGVKWLFVWD
ncbi:MAG: DUF4349 domain-containing protein [Deltaproteobacteria bacterium]|nr:DUF4349 domain-containing protein [Deltaproteobacteria bacterium]